MHEPDWSEAAKRLLRAEMVRRSVSTAELATRLGENERTVSNKLGQGRFSAAWLLRCLTLIGSREIRID